MLSNTDDQRPDSQGRISIPARMREYAGLNKDVVIAGVGKRMEVWDAEEWAATRRPRRRDTPRPSGTCSASSDGNTRDDQQHSNNSSTTAPGTTA